MWSARAIAAIFWSAITLGVALSPAADEPSKPAPGVKPPWQRYLAGENARKAAALENQLPKLQEAGNLGEAHKMASDLVELREKIQGKDHWQAVNARWDAEAFRRALAEPDESQASFASLPRMIRDTSELKKKNQHKEAHEIDTTILAIRRQVLGEVHSHVATSLNNLAVDLHNQRKLAAAREVYGKALGVYRDTVGEDHPATAQVYLNLATCLDATAKYALAEPFHRQGLAINGKTFGENRSQAIAQYTNLAVNLNAQRKPVQAEEAYRKALAVAIAVRGEDSLETVVQLHSLASQLNIQRKYADAEPYYRKITTIRQKLQGEDHPDTTSSYVNLADCLRYQNKHAVAEPFLRRILASRIKKLSENHAQTAAACYALAENMKAQKKYAAAEEFYQRLLSIRRTLAGEGARETADAYDHVAGNFNDQDKYPEAEAALRKALAIRRKLFGDENAVTAWNIQRIAYALHAQRKYPEAEEFCRQALALHRKLFKEEKFEVMASYRTLAHNLYMQDKYVESEELYRKLLAFRVKTLGEQHVETGSAYASLGLTLERQAKYAEAEAVQRKALAIRRAVLGEQHADTAVTRAALAACQKPQGKLEEAEENLLAALAIRKKVLGDSHADVATTHMRLGEIHTWQAKYALAETDYRNALAIRRQLFGEEHPATTLSHHELAGNLMMQGKYAAAEDDHRQLLANCRKLYGDEDIRTAVAYDKLAHYLYTRGNNTEAEGLSRQALAISRKARGENHHFTATFYNTLGRVHSEMGRIADAGESYRKALDIRRKQLGEENTNTAQSYGALAINLHAQGKIVEAEILIRKSLDIYLKVLGDEHIATAIAQNNVAHFLLENGRYAEAESGFRKAMAVYRRDFDETHPAMAHIHHGLALALQMQGKDADAILSLKQALAIRRQVMGEEHSDTAHIYKLLGICFNAQGKYADAEVNLRAALGINRKVRGDGHQGLVASYNALASCLEARGKYAEAEDLYVLSADCFNKSRLLLAKTGLDRAATTTSSSPLPPLAAVLARNGKPEQAWQRFEESLARGTLDDFSVRLHRSPADQAKVARLLVLLENLDQLIEKMPPGREQSQELKKKRGELLTQRKQAQDDLDALVRDEEKAQGPVVGQVFDLATIQASLPADAALVGYLDLPPQLKATDPSGVHLAFVLRSRGKPVVVKLLGSGPNHAWTGADTNQPALLGSALQAMKSDWRPLARRMHKQRLEPLGQHLSGIRHLIVLPSTALAGVPVEAFAEGYTVSYALSGTMYAHAHKQQKQDSQGLFALADPVFEDGKPLPPAKSAPPGGLFVKEVVTGSTAEKAGLKAGDVLLRYADAPLNQATDLTTAIAAHAAAERVSITVWREGLIEKKQAAAGKLGVLYDTRPAPEVFASLDSASGKWEPLPGTRSEVECLRRLFARPDHAPKILTDSAASEQQVYDLANNGDLGKYRYLHFATHGEVNQRFPLRSAVILARDNLPDAGKQLEGGLPIFDGRLSAEEVLRHWNLKAELVTLSACQTALGKYEGGEGFVGFAQALTVAGARAVCLSLWKVDDTATALLMERFYQNLLGKRDGLNAPMKKAEALNEAKSWLRGVSRQEAAKLSAAITKNVSRGKGRPALALLSEIPKPRPEEKDDRPYAHPYYWAAFVLIGDPE